VSSSTSPPPPEPPEGPARPGRPAPDRAPDRAPDPTITRRVRAADASPWNWLLLVPIVLCLLTPVFNRATPTLFGFPAFYWLQLLFVLVGVATTVTVYQLTKRKRGE
jgi:hypothetical protein